MATEPLSDATLHPVAGHSVTHLPARSHPESPAWRTWAQPGLLRSDEEHEVPRSHPRASPSDALEVSRAPEPLRPV